MFTTKRPFLGFIAPPKPFGLARAAVRHDTARPVLHEGKAHCLSIGQTGSGKTNLMIANLLLWEGSAIVIDVRGDAMRATARWRRDALGQKVYVLNPFASGGSPDRLDPLDLAALPGADLDTEAQTIAALLVAAWRDARDPYWHMEGANVLGGIACFLMDPPIFGKQRLSMNGITELLFAPDFDERVADLLERYPLHQDNFWYRSLGAYLNIPDSDSHCGTRSSVLATARTMLQPFRSQAVQSAMGPSTFDLRLLLEGRPVTVYLVLPVERIFSHAMVLGCWLEVVCQALLRRTTLPDLPTLLFVDECAQFGCVSNALKLIAVSMRGQGVKLWSFFQDFGQIKTMFGTDVSTFINSNSAITVLPGTGMAAREAEALLGIPERQVAGLAEDEQLVYEVGREARTVKMARYWTDELFRGRFDPPAQFMTNPAPAASQESSHSRAGRRKPARSQVSCPA